MFLDGFSAIPKYKIHGKLQFVNNNAPEVNSGKSLITKRNATILEYYGIEIDPKTKEYLLHRKGPQLLSPDHIWIKGLQFLVDSLDNRTTHVKHDDFQLSLTFTTESERSAFLNQTYQLQSEIGFHRRRPAFTEGTRLLKRRQGPQKSTSGGKLQSAPLTGYANHSIPLLTRRLSEPNNLSSDRDTASVSNHTFSHNRNLSKDTSKRRSPQDEEQISSSDAGRKRPRLSELVAHDGKRERACSSASPRRPLHSRIPSLTKREHSSTEEESSANEAENRDLKYQWNNVEASTFRSRHLDPRKPQTLIDILSSPKKIRRPTRSLRDDDDENVSENPESRFEERTSLSDVPLSTEDRTRSVSVKQGQQISGITTRAGFRNIGNSCYISCILAALCSVNGFVEKMKTFGLIVHRIVALRNYLKCSGAHKCYLTRSDSSEYKIPGCGLFNAIISLAIDFQAMSSSDGIDIVTSQTPTIGVRGTSIDIGTLKSLMTDHCPSFAGFEQQDAQEFLIILLDLMEEQLICRLRQLIKEAEKEEKNILTKELSRKSLDDYSNEHLETERERLASIRTELFELEATIGFRSKATDESGSQRLDDSKACDSGEGSSGSPRSSSTRHDSASCIPLSHLPLKLNPSSPISIRSSPEVESLGNVPFSFGCLRLFKSDDELKSLLPSGQMTSGEYVNFLKCPTCCYRRSQTECFRVLTLNIPMNPNSPSGDSQNHSIQVAEATSRSFLAELEKLPSSSNLSKWSDQSNEPPIKLEELLYHFMRFHYRECRCSQDGCNAIQVEVKSQFTKCPQILLLHINRIVPKRLTDSSLIKVRRRVDVPLNLCLSGFVESSDNVTLSVARDYCWMDTDNKEMKNPTEELKCNKSQSEEDEDISVVLDVHDSDLAGCSNSREISTVPKYILKAVVSHIGQRPQSGHFVCYIRDQGNVEYALGSVNEIGIDMDSIWYCHNDSDVRIVTSLVVERAVQRDGYILVYER